MENLNRKKFYDRIRETIFKGKISQVQVDNMNVILGEWESRGLNDLKWLAYMLATVYHETGHTMQPVREYGQGKGRKYGIADPETGKVYYGRGYVQLTWKANYDTFGKLLHLDLVKDPDLVLKTSVSTFILFEGMTRGLFTGKKLSDYFEPCEVNEESWINARRIINGIDQAELIAGYAKDFFAALI